MTLNKDLFFELCEEYGVQFSKDYETVMLRDDDGHVRELCEEDVQQIMLPSKAESNAYIDCESVNINIEILPAMNLFLDNFSFAA